MSYITDVARHVDTLSPPEIKAAIDRIAPRIEAGTADKGRLLFFVLLSWRLAQLEPAA